MDKIEKSVSEIEQKAREARTALDQFHESLEKFIEKSAQELSDRIDADIIWQTILEENPDWHVVEIPWQQNIGTEEQLSMFEAITEWIVGKFGEPNKVYVTTADYNSLKIAFKNREDAILTILRWK